MRSGCQVSQCINELRLANSTSLLSQTPGCMRLEFIRLRSTGTSTTRSFRASEPLSSGPIPHGQRWERPFLERLTTPYRPKRSRRRMVTFAFSRSQRTGVSAARPASSFLLLQALSDLSRRASMPSYGHQGSSLGISTTPRDCKTAMHSLGFTHSIPR
jgi:hypothetical protein